LWGTTLAATVLGCSFELWWFSRTCFNEIDYDGIGYIGIARHIRQGEFYAAVNALRSPMMSWLIAAGSFVDGNYLQVGKLVNMGSFVLCVALVYALTASLWRSRVAAAVAALLLTLGRALAASAVESITPDFLFAALAAVYFLLLLRALRNDRVRDWFFAGTVHGFAFLCKAFALPWLAVCTVTAVILCGRPWKPRVIRLAAAALVPALMAAGWATVLHAKYGVFTTGSQFRLNILQWTLRATDEHPDPTYLVLIDTTQDYGEYGVLDMPRSSWMWTYPIELRQAFPKIIRAEMRNVPQAVKEMIIVETPGAMFAFVFALAVLGRRRHESPAEWRFAAVAAVAVVSLVTAYAMLVVDSRYLYPLMPLVLAVAAGFLGGAGKPGFGVWRRICVFLVVVGVVFSLTYRSSSFRTLTRDFQSSCRDAGNRLHAHNAARFVSLGAGPFPEHGVGWEAGFKAGYFGASRIIGTTNTLPDSSQLSALPGDVEKASPDAILVWGRPENPRRASLLQTLMAAYPHSSVETILDPALGEVGLAIFR